MRPLLFGLSVCALASFSCSPGVRSGVSSDEARKGLAGRTKAQVNEAFARGDWDAALTTCQAVLAEKPDDCGARYGDLLARTMQVVDRVNAFMPLAGGPFVVFSAGLDLAKLEHGFKDTAAAAERALALGCRTEVPRIPFRFGPAEAPLVTGDLRGQWTPRDAHLIAALMDSARYLLENTIDRKKLPEPAKGAGPLFTGASANPPLPGLLEAMRAHLLAHDALLFAEPADPDLRSPRGGWFDRNGNHTPDAKDELLIDLFEPSSDRRVFDFSEAEFVKGEAMPKGPITPTEKLPPARCGYETFHIDEVVSGKDVGPTDGMSFSADGQRLALPLLVKGKFQIHLLDLNSAIKKGDPLTRRCLTCDQPGNNDGVRFQPSEGGKDRAILFVSDRDHRFPIGGDGGGVGQELYAMRADGTAPTRLTTSHDYGSNYHPNWSMDGKRIVWGSTDSRAWDVMVADFVSDAKGMRLEHVRRVVHDTTWWETHGFTKDGKQVILTNSRAGFNSPDIYALDLETGRRTRFTDDPRWDEHAHLSPDGRELAWISGRHHPAAVATLNDGSISPLFDFLWIVPGIFFEIMPPAGYSMELTLADADGNHLRPLTHENQVVADNEWSPDGRRIVFRQSNQMATETTIRILTFDDCHLP